MTKKRGLGKSLDALLSYSSKKSLASDVADDKKGSLNTIPGDQLCELSLSQIERGQYQPRREMDPEALQELADSIRSQGVIQPILVRPIGDRYEIIAGERRFRAAHLAGLTEIPAIIRSLPDEATLAVALIENIQRENLNPIEEALALQRLLDEFSLTHQQIAQAVGKSRASVSNLLRLLQLPESIRHALERHELEMGHARALLTLNPEQQLKAAFVIKEKKLSVRETEQLVRRMQQTHAPLKNGAHLPNPDILQLQESLSKSLRSPVKIHCNAQGRGKLVIRYKSLLELDAIIEKLQREKAQRASQLESA